MAASDSAFDWTDAEKDVRAYQVVGKSLLERIRSGEFRTIGKLPPERELAEVYNVGRAVIRDALVMLEVKGLVQSRQGSGIYITRKAYEADAVDHAANLGNAALSLIGPANPVQLLEAQQWLESHIAQIAATKITDDDLRILEKAYDDYVLAQLREVRERLDMAFHLAISRGAQNPEFTGMVAALWHRRDNNPLWMSLMARTPDDPRKSTQAENYRKIVDALKRRDQGGAFFAMWQHFEHIKTIALVDE
ncbi:FadR/GntR family transcriptional regulator [Asticcacaulis sp. SL142]|uniref:FadR/GntR family transcriptional regulator n=1 Tax=Asticcacaulis sp. SL142 TaxID=2995155 RepID=UPI00226D3B05|nr:FadR/GntR family transcriptional regulator [Asticcacaulis sp. SL142]WAC48395.1 FadR/GntR family transcriptional regulator [Asticcacaulis sp. SL142]